MKTLLSILLGFLTFLVFVLVKHYIPDADFSTNISVIEVKSQDQLQAENHVATYTIRCYDDNQECHYRVKIVMPENFGQVNQHIYFSNGTNMFAGSSELETRIKR